MAAVGVLCLSPLLLAGLIVVAAAGGGAALSSQAASCADGLDTFTLARRTAALLAENTDDDAEGLALPGEQIPNAYTIVTTGILMDVPERGQLVALVTALQESRLRNLPYGDRDSLGLFQQRPSQGWGSPQEILDPVYASTRFYQALLGVSGWQQLTLGQAAQAVQRSAYPEEYAKWEPLATALRTALADIVPAASAEGALVCRPGEDGSGWGAIPEGAIPEGYTVPADAPPQVRTALSWAMLQLGTPYQWGGSCTDAHGPDPLGRCDCSSLMQQAYAAAGISLSRTTYTQVGEGTAVPVAGPLKPGDLIFTRGTAAVPEHVGMYMGSGLVINAPRTGTVVRVEAFDSWASQVLAVRRIVRS